MNVHLIAEICAGIGVVATVFWSIIGVKALKLLREIREHVKTSHSERL